jgi:hypothetical protein
MNNTISDLGTKMQNFNSSNVKVGHAIAGVAGVISLVGLITFMVLVSKQQKKKGLSSSKVLAANLFMFVILGSLLAEITMAEGEDNYFIIGLSFLVLVCVASLVITLLM